MKIKIISHPKQTLEVNNVFVGSDLHINHEFILKFRKEFNNVEEMNNTIYTNINNKVGKDDLLVLLGDTMMVNKDYNKFLSLINCENVIMLYGNHCNIRRFEEIESNKLKYHGYYLELSIDRQIICCSHYPMFHWGNFMCRRNGKTYFTGNCHGDEPSDILKEIHKYKCIDVGIDNYHNIFGTYDVFSFQDIENLLHNKLIAHRH